MMSANSDDLAVIQGVLGRRTPEGQLELLSISLGSEIRRRRFMEQENALLRKEIAEQSEAMEKLREALARAENDRDLFFATVVHNVPDVVEESGSDTPATGEKTRRVFQNRDEALVCVRHLLHPFCLDHHCSDQGLSVDPNALRRGEGDFTTSERVLLLAAHDLLSEDPELALLDVVEHLRGEALGMLVSLVMAVATGKAAIHQWLSESLVRSAELRCLGGTDA